MWIEKWTRLVGLSFGLALAVICGGCGPKSVSESDATATKPVAESKDETIMVLCGSSFRLPMEKLAAEYEQKTGRKLEMAYGGSEDHLPRVKMKKYGDVFVTHTPFMQYTRDAGALLREISVGSFSPALVVKKGNPKKVQSIDDLKREGLRVILPNPEYSTCGQMIFTLLEKKGIKEAVLKNVENALVRSHAQVAAPIKMGHRDAGIMWNGIANNWLDSIEIVPTPYEYDQEIGVSVMGLSYTKKKEAVEAFLDFVDKRGKPIFKEFGYEK